MENKAKEFIYVTVSGLKIHVKVLPDTEYKGEAIAQVWENKDGTRFVKVPNKNLCDLMNLLRGIG